MSLDVSIAVPTLNRAARLEDALRSMQSIVVPDGWRVEIVVVDNGSTDETQTVAEASGSSGPLTVRFVVEANQGLNRARNRALMESPAEWIVFLDDDVLADRGWLCGLAEALEAFAPDCVVGPVYPWFEDPPATWLTPKILDSVTSSYSLKGDTVHVVRKGRAHELPGCNFAVRRRTAIDAGGFHRSLGRTGTSMLAGEDWELGVRLERLDRTVVYSPRCSIRHFISRHKVSPEGLRDRWRGLGATNRAFAVLDGKSMSYPSYARLYGRLAFRIAQSYALRARRDTAGALEAELEASYLLGYLLSAPRIEARRWPPTALREADV